MLYQGYCDKYTFGRQTTACTSFPKTFKLLSETQIKELAKIHCDFINLNDAELKQIEEIADTFAYNKKLGKVVDVVKTQKSWEGFAIFAFKRMKNAKKTRVDIVKSRFSKIHP